ncbi:MAG: hypothetical protein K2J79_11290 [Ruminiclostridium sp.]|nr:hypothetical protein [Ruminiclostridium sp.]
MKVKQKTIRSHIRSGTRKILFGAFFLALVYSLCLVFIYVCQQSCVRYGDNQALASDSIIEANSIFRAVDNAVYENNPSLMTTMDTSNFDKLYEASLEESGAIVENIRESKRLYDSFLESCTKVLELSKSDNEAAKELCDDETYRALNTLTESLHTISADFVRMNSTASSIVVSVITFSVIGGLFVLVIMTIYYFIVSNKMTNSISVPVVEVAEWAEKLSMGSDDIGASNIHEDPLMISISEIHRMILAFTAMSKSVKENVDIVRRVSEGDMTAYVNIRSSEDSLGKSLYKMVQSNDIMFAQITQIADSVTDGTNAISEAAQDLAESCTKQAEAIHTFREDIALTNQLVRENAKDAENANKISDAIRNEVVVSKEKMKDLVEAMKAIFDASKRVSGVIGEIESIADQTNLLAINAAIEASRAGQAGKSFAVVASSVKQLAEKSTESAKHSKELIDDTVTKASHGSQLSDETFAAFESIMESLEEIIGVSKKIASSGFNQQKNMEEIEKSITEISDIVSANAASSEETAAMTNEITTNANVLKESMKQFNLRDRKPGKPYIPPEKANDIDFVRVATENYERFAKSPEGKKMLREMNGG